MKKSYRHLLAIIAFFLINSIQCRVRWDYKVVSVCFLSGLVWWPEWEWPVYFNVWSPVGGCWGRIERYAFLGGGVSLSDKLKLQKPPLYSECTLYANWPCYKMWALSYSCHNVFAPMSWTLTLWHHKAPLNTCFYKYPESWCFSTVSEK